MRVTPFLKKILLLLLAGFFLFIISLFLRRKGELLENQNVAVGAVNVRISLYNERYLLPSGGGRYFIEIAKKETNEWRELVYFRLDEAYPLPTNNIRAINEQTCFIFLGWTYLVTTDGGESWNKWDAPKYFSSPNCCKYFFIKEVVISTNGSGKMFLDSDADQPKIIYTQDFGISWNRN